MLFEGDLIIIKIKDKMRMNKVTIINKEAISIIKHLA